MLKKSFKIAKCKTSLKLATSRIKLLKNKKVIQINQMKKELAQLLESGDDRTARIRVEHVIREENLVSAYELIEIYCELIVARLPIIESQKTCPIDLKEAITSVIFAAPRCSDIPELVDVRKNFTAKYGKEFVSAALELRPDCGVSRMMVEKLSAVAPNVQTKVKVLSDVAKEHNINWDPTLFEEKESKPPDDLLNGPTNFENASTITVDPPKTQSSNVHNVHNHDEMTNVPLDFSQQNRRYTLDAQKSSASTNDDMRPSGMASETMNMRHSFNSNNNNSFSSRENWNMEFKDATSAAQAAAESAERASIAARAAAHLSSQGKIHRQYSSESHNSHISNENPQVSYNNNNNTSPKATDRSHRSDSRNSRSRNDASEYEGSRSENFNYLAEEVIRKKSSVCSSPTEYDTSPKASERSSKSRFRNDSSENEGSRSENVDYLAEEFIRKQTSIRNRNDTSPKASERSRRSDSINSRSRSDSDEYENSKSENVDYYVEEVIRKQPSIRNRNDISPKASERARRSDSLQSRNDSVNKTSRSENNDYLAEEVTRKRPSVRSSRSKSNSTIINDERDTLTSVDHGDRLREATRTNSYGDSRRNHETESESDEDDGPKFDTGFEYDESEARLFFPSPGRESIPTVDKNTDTWSPEIKPVDPLNDPDSEHAKSRFNVTKKVSFSPHPEPSQIVNSGKTRMQLNDLVHKDHINDPDSECENEVAISRINVTKKLNSPRKHEYIESSQKVNSTKSRLELNELVSEEFNDSDDGKELKFGTLTGGIRNKNELKYKKSVEELPVKVKQTSNPSSFSSRTRLSENKKTSVSVSTSGSDSDDYDNKFSVQSSKYRSRFAPPDTFFNDDGIDSEAEEEVPPVRKPIPTNKVNLGSEVSRRTKGHVEPEGKTVISSSKLEPLRKTPEPKVSERPPNSPKKIAESRKYEAHKTSNLSSGSSAEENNVKKPSHVHPKLPDYDSLAARIQSLRTNHQ